MVKEQVANKIAAVVNDLFCPKVSPIIALKWKEIEDMASYLIENQPPCVNKVIQSQSYHKDGSVDYIECDELTMSSEGNRVLTTQVHKESICSVKGHEENTSQITDNKLTDPVCGQINLKVNDDNREKHKRTALRPKRIRRPPQKREKDFL
jgi:hypothetical protein